jgi:hypothetical protein
MTERTVGWVPMNFQPSLISVKVRVRSIGARSAGRGRWRLSDQIRAADMKNVTTSK